MAVVVGALVVVATAQAADPDAPPGASAIWLPQVPWVMQHYMPYDETKLFADLDLSRNQVLQWLTAHHDHAPLADLARARGYTVNRLAAQLVGPRTPGQSPAMHQQLIERARLTLTQPHLAHHLLGHLMHEWAVLRTLPALMHYSSLQPIERLRASGLSFAAIAQWNGVSGRSLRAEMLRVLTATARAGLRSGQETAAQERFWLGEQRAILPRWLSQLPHRAAGLGDPTDVGSDAVSLLCHLL